MKSNWEEIAIEVLAEHMGALAYVVLADAKSKTKSSLATQPHAFLPELIIRIAQELPEAANRSAITAELRQKLK